ncbi:uncharacterized protein LOC107790586 [Nicotiana tabacum]|uniref:Uncharacterized protein LOC107790586 n=3 Tax=Nicotiana TaxID=4085 RepID=A0AC58TRK0_TOBAC|nr:PREDICTED: uncharacterized protein LOC104214226 isoform X1 [Nicotiana sylvestris]XP_009762183.1 PREDICTED: uncharacterized protein LOC104214226 isoform X2 [Nicotiana sylvestris]
MDLTTISQSISYANLPKLPSLFHSRATLCSSNSINILGFNCIPRKLKCNARQLRQFGAIHASVAESNSTNVSVTWLLEFIGDGDARHIGSPTAKPGSLEIPSGAVTVGRVAEKADMVIPVPTVSAVHALLQSMEEYLVVTDLDSTNGTFIGEKRLRPGVAAAALPGSLLTFGDTNLAIFRVAKLEKMETPSEPEEAEANTEEEKPSSS